MSGNPGTQAVAGTEDGDNRRQQLAPDHGADTAAGGESPVRDHSSGLDRITLRGIRGYGHHGVYAFERERGQRFEVDLTCRLDLSAAAAGDDLGETLDYGELTGQVVADIEGEPLHLVEALALRVARTCLASTRVQEVEVTVHKPEAPIQADVADVAVTLTRSRTCE